MNVYTITPNNYPVNRFMKKLNKKDTGCWEWTGKIHRKDGYGIAYLDYKEIMAHRLSYALFVGPLVEGLTIDHLCRNRRCVNPNHLEQVTKKENSLRGEGITAQMARRTHCKYGHEFDEANTRWYRGSRQCRACYARRARERKARLKA